MLREAGASRPAPAGRAARAQRLPGEPQQVERARIAQQVEGGRPGRHQRGDAGGGAKRMHQVGRGNAQARREAAARPDARCRARARRPCSGPGERNSASTADAGTAQSVPRLDHARCCRPAGAGPRPRPCAPAARARRRPARRSRCRSRRRWRSRTTGAACADRRRRRRTARPARRPRRAPPPAAAARPRPCPRAGAAHRNMPPAGVLNSTPRPCISRVERGQHGVALALVERADGRHVAIEEAVFHHLGHHALVEAGAVQVGRLLGLQQLRVDRPWAPPGSPAAGPAPAPSRTSRGRCSLRGCARSAAAAAPRRTTGRRRGCPRRSAGRPRAAAAETAARRASLIVRPVGFWKLGSR